MGLLLALAVLLTLSAQNEQPMHDVRVSIVGMVPLVAGQPEPEVLEFKLENRTRKTVTAWKVQLESVQKGARPPAFQLTLDTR